MYFVKVMILIRLRKYSKIWFILFVLLFKEMENFVFKLCYKMWLIVISFLEF